VTLVFVGTYAEALKDGIFVLHWDSETGALSPVSSVDAGPNPTYLALHPKLPRIYTVNEAPEIEGVSGGAVTSLRFEKSGTLTVLERQMVGGSYPCHISLSPSLSHLLVANYTLGDGSISVLPLSAEGTIAALSDFVPQGGPGERSLGHCILTDPSGTFVLTVNLGLNRIFLYRLNVYDGILIPHEPPFVALPGPSETLPRGVGPRHLVFSSDSRFLYCINEYASSITAFAWNASAGILSEIQTISTLPADYAAKNTGAAIHFSPDGRFLYASNRGHDSLAVFSVDSKTGILTLQTHVPTGGGHPRDFAFDPTGEFVVTANRDANNLVVFRVDRTLGTLTPTGQEVFVPRPVCVKFMPSSWGSGDES
jgi:6-phosphogluconolactonase